MSGVQVVSGFIPIHGHPRTTEEYQHLGMQLFSELAAMKVLDYPIAYFQGSLERCWLHQWLLAKGKNFRVTHSTADNPNKNTLAYHIVQHEKIAMLQEAAISNPEPDVFVWLDFGILHVPGVTTQVVADFLQKVKKEKTITIPGCWSRAPVDDSGPCWRFCGGLIIVPREYVFDLDALFRAEVIRRVNDTRNVSWEVNALARLELTGQPPIWWYGADHNETMFTAYPEATANA